MAHVHIEPVVRYFDIVIDDLDGDSCRNVWRQILSGEDRKVLGIKKLELLKDVASTTRVYMEAGTNSERLRHDLWMKITAWFSEQADWAPTRTRLEDRLVINLAEKPKVAAA